MEQPNPTFAKILILDTGKFEQWKFMIQQYLQNENYALWEVIEFGDSYEAPQEVVDTGSTSEGSTKKKGRTVAVTTEDIQKRRNDVKARTILLLALPDEHQLRFSKYKTAQELWAAILKTFGGNEATKKTKKNQLKQQYGNFKAEGKETLDGKEEVNTASFSTASTQVSPSSVDVATASFSHDTVCAYIASQSNGSPVKYEYINQINEDDIEEMDIKWNMALLSHFARECRAPRSQDRGRRENFKQGSKTEEQTPKDLMAIDKVGWDWSYMANEEEDHALVADQEAPTEFALMAKSSSDTEVEARLVEFKNQENKFCEKIRGLEFKVESKYNRTERLTNELEELKKEKTGLDSKLTGFQSASKDLNTLLGSQRSDKNKEGLGYSSFSNLDYDCAVWEEQGKTWPKNNNTHKRNKGKAVKASSCWIWRPKQNFTDKGPNSNSVSVIFKKYQYIDTQGRLKSDSGCSRHMTGNISYLSDYEPYDGGYVSFGQGCGKITGKVMTDDFSRFTWTFFLKTKDETSSILRNFITEIENLKELKNGVAERRNRTLIEAARTMLVDAKLLVTFWAEAVNTTCYVQNRVLVNKSQNKTPYELFNSRTHAIGFLKPFGCHVMILNTLDKLGKFDAKGDKVYFIGYSMSSKAFRVFNKRTKRVEENLHVDFLENKLIEKGAGPNWLFDIDTLTNSMNYVPVVVAGTTSTNFSGTKDDASQDVKKYVSSLRYIALPNWFHEAHLESSTSNAQDACNADAIESSGNSNPTATSTDPPADHMETLTVESPISTVSSSVLTACLDDSPEPSSDTRLISKRVTSQDDTPSLDNILTLSNRFEDILEVTTNTGDTNRVEADLVNMENNISDSPTPTFRIHTDHPKS
nr:hypothetical protein [Tanacetum cinerariifolium]